MGLSLVAQFYCCKIRMRMSLVQRWDLITKLKQLIQCSIAHVGYFYKLILYFWLCRVITVVCRFSLVVASGVSSGSGSRASHSAASLAAEHELWARESFSSYGTIAQLLPGMCNIPRLGNEPVSPALARRFLTTVPPGKFSIAYHYYYSSEKWIAKIWTLSRRELWSK